MYGGGELADRRTSVGESREEWLILRSIMGTVKMMNGEREYWRVCSVVGVSKADWGCGRRIVEVYKRFAGSASWGPHYLAILCLEFLDNSRHGARACVA